ncbi:MAG: HAD-IA family hydrolase [Nevskia sp.]
MNPIPLCVLFDLDGTLLDSAPDLGLAANLVREGLGMAPLPLDDYRPQASNGARGLLKVALDIAPGQADYEMHKDAFLRHYQANLVTHTRAFDGVPELLAALDEAGLRWGVVTNKVGWLARPVMAGTGLAARAACLVAGDSTPHPKPAPDGLLLAARELGLAAGDCIYVGDDLRDIVAGHAAGMRTVAAGWGYLGAHPDLSTWQADAIAMTPQALIAMIALRHAA